MDSPGVECRRGRVEDQRREQSRATPRRNQKVGRAESRTESRAKTKRVSNRDARREREKTLDVPLLQQQFACAWRSLPTCSTTAAAALSHDIGKSIARARALGYHNFLAVLSAHSSKTYALLAYCIRRERVNYYMNAYISICKNVIYMLI